MERARNSRRGDIDMISSLPDCLIHIIMSFLTAQEAIQTCVLSKRWKNLWTTLPFLDFDLHKFKYHTELEDGVPKRNRVDIFIGFVSTTLLLRKPFDLHKFCVSGLKVSHFDMMRSWILYALKHNLQVLNIDLMQECLMPPNVFNCASLVDASVAYSLKSLQNIEVINLPCLRRLSLKGAGAHITQDFVDKLFYGCPVLEFLNLEYCYRDFSSINSQSLKYLNARTICSCRETKKRMELINTPNLLSFLDNICPYLGGQHMPLNMPSLNSASICMEKCHYNWPHKNKSNILMGLLNVQNLELSGFELKAFLEAELSHCPEFSNAKDLSVDGLCLSCHFYRLAAFLNHFPNLEKLLLYYRGCSCKLRVPAKKTIKLAPFEGKRLRTVEVKFSKSSKYFPQVVKNLQNYTKNSRAQINMTGLNY
ncbi:F-box/RNI-like superfamily protein [Rhynchospora pubera]|uniref:F-box/RNI-like superfamily protein n=1 Tax=Rhynchospora pubera TaxID=906938 RepID=A0AAV8HL91_9POAL|nr:F-box/RNI-like superfamily protein [Rhynchospora pubera]